MNYVGMTEIIGGARELTDTELTMVAGGGVWGDLLKIAGGVIGNLVIGGAVGGGIGAGMVVVGQAVYNGYDSSVPAGSGVNSSIADAAL